MSVTSITAKTNQGHWMNSATWEEGTPRGIEATVTQKRGGIINCGISELSMEQHGANELWNLSYTGTSLMGFEQLWVYTAPQQLHHPTSIEGLRRRWREHPRGTCHPEGPAQAWRELPGVVVPQLHPAHTHDLTHKTDLLPLQVLAAQVLQRGVTSGCFLIAEFKFHFSRQRFCCSEFAFAAQASNKKCSQSKADFVAVLQHLTGVLCKSIP